MPRAALVGILLSVPANALFWWAGRLPAEQQDSAIAGAVAASLVLSLLVFGWPRIIGMTRWWNEFDVETRRFAIVAAAITQSFALSVGYLSLVSTSIDRPSGTLFALLAFAMPLLWVAGIVLATVVYRKQKRLRRSRTFRRSPTTKR